MRVIALSRDTAAEVARHAARDDLDLLLLSDPDLRVIRAFGLLHEKAGRFSTFEVLGVPLGFPTGKQGMAIPTTLLVDEGGVVRWIDQAEDYRIRGDTARIEQALAEVFGEAPPAG